VVDQNVNPGRIVLGHPQDMVLSQALGVLDWNPNLGRIVLRNLPVENIPTVGENVETMLINGHWKDFDIVQEVVVIASFIPVVEESRLLKGWVKEGTKSMMGTGGNMSRVVDLLGNIKRIVFHARSLIGTGETVGHLRGNIEKLAGEKGRKSWTRLARLIGSSPRAWLGSGVVVHC